MIQGKRLTPDQALQKARHYCGYQERCHQEVKTKLFGFGLNRQEVDNALSALIEEDYLNEERFAIQFAGGKFRMKGWGRSRIKMELKQRQVSEYCIKKAMKEIPDPAYYTTLEKLARIRWESLKDEDKTSRLRKTQDHLIYKGYEWDLIKETLKGLESQE
jgi:regulatory protein